MYGKWLLFFASICATIAVPFSGSLSQQAQPKFTSGGLQVVVNRAVRPGPTAQLVISLVMTNLGDDDVAVVWDDPPRVITDTGETAAAARVSGIQEVICGPSYHAECLSRSPTLIERHNSITVTMFFQANRGSRDSKVCSVDFSMPLFIQRERGGSRGRDNWRQITVGLPNVMVC